jgi:hypothetical protein
MSRTRSILVIAVWLAITTAVIGYQSYSASQRWDAGSRAVGALFVRVGPLTLRHPFCTATVVPSPRGNVLITAAHCLAVPVARMQFAPWWHDGRAPYGLYQVTSEAMLPAWTRDGNPNADVAFLTISGNAQKLAGADQLGSSVPVPDRVTVDGYSFPDGENVCANKVTTVAVNGQRQLRFACKGYIAGSSGGPFLTGVGASTLGTIVGVLGGYQNGGTSSAVSYSAPIGPAVHRLYESVLAGDRT